MCQKMFGYPNCHTRPACRHPLGQSPRHSSCKASDATRAAPFPRRGPPVRWAPPRAACLKLKISDSGGRHLSDQLPHSRIYLWRRLCFARPLRDAVTSQVQLPHSTRKTVSPVGSGQSRLLITVRCPPKQKARPCDMPLLKAHPESVR